MRGRVVVVTGSSRGIGLELAFACARDGARVVVHGRDQGRLTAAVASICSAGGEAIGIRADLSRPDGPELLIRSALDAFGRIDVLVNNAAVTTGREPLWTADPVALHAVVAVNIVAPILCARAVLAWAMPRAETVRIVNVSSGIVEAPRTDAASYIASKAALEGLTRALALDVSQSTVVVTAVALGGHRTELSRGVVDAEEHARLPAAADAVSQLVAAILAPADEVHGRVLRVARERALDIDGVDLFAEPSASPAARGALSTVALEGPIERYPEAACTTLRKVLAARFGVGLDAVVIGGGTSELLERVLAVAARPGETVIANAPSWPLWPYLCQQRRLTWRAVPYRLMPGHADHDLDAVLAAIDRTVRAVYLTSPANPVGRALDREPFARFLDAVPRHVTVIVDEAYAEYITRDDALQAAALARWSDRSLVVLRTFSKAYALAGLRIAYAITTPALARRLAAAAPPFPIVRGAEEAAVAALADVAHLRTVVARAAAARTALEARLGERGIEWLASDAPFVLAAIPERRGPRYFDDRYVMLPIGKEPDV
ncbi:MAG: aminotransferase class I/II-fold pyridoxal phosphate-dependent enzyme [Myxococcales bacterium]|nr:aminotransferase class I/II-fold pyridoxal phosphate-dependent enzyme [Myxococcales bacterium]